MTGSKRGRSAEIREPVLNLKEAIETRELIKTGLRLTPHKTLESAAKEIAAHFGPGITAEHVIEKLRPYYPEQKGLTAFTFLHTEEGRNLDNTTYQRPRAIMAIKGGHALMVENAPAYRINPVTRRKTLIPQLFLMKLRLEDAIEIKNAQQELP
ncbi:TPA: hypothetical protein HA318_05815 [Candidatus Micrarchaeota archaeon]|nr:MAG: hypothetical protein AUJ65_02910 [Candidatus Micrarchaeota archaeon CG1_02_51_15]HII39485.1 hypothetical protein [Candidatus Micrarchaeota archaeon]